MLEDQVAYLLQRYLGNYVRGLNKEALKISVWKGDVELKNMQLKPEALNALKLPVKVKAGFLGSVKLKVPWSRLGQDPVLVYLDRIFLLAEPATQVEGWSEDTVQEAKKSRIQEMELKLWEKSQQLKSEMNKSWLGSLISTIIGNLKLSISNIHIRYEDCESNPGHPFAAGVMLDKLSAMTVDDTGKETFITGGALDRIQKSVELDRLAVYFDSDIIPWQVNQAWEDLLPSEWFQVFKFGTRDGRPADYLLRKHSYILQPVTGKAKYSKLQLNETTDSKQPLQKAVVNLDDVTISLSKDGYRDIMKLADNFAAFNQRLKYAHYRPLVPVKVDPKSWWKYAYRAVSDQMKKASGKMSWEQVLRYASLRKRYISLYASLLKSDPNQVTITGNKEIEELDRELDIELILQWRMLAHKFVEQSAESDLNLRKQKAGKSWWSFGWTSQAPKEESEEFNFTEEDWNRLNKIIGYKEGDDGQSAISKADVLHTYLVVHMNHNASKLIGEAKEPVADLSCEDLSCTVKLYPETKVFDIKLGSYQLSSPKGLLAESATSHDSLVGVFYYKPFDDKVDWSMVAKASPCYMTYMKDTIDQIVQFFESDTAVSQTIALETAAAVQMTIDEVKRTAQQQMNRALRDHARFSLNLDIAAPKITIPTDFCPDNVHATKLLLDLGNLMIRTQDDHEQQSTEENMYLRFDLVLSDVSAFLFDGDYHWSQISLNNSAHSTSSGFFPLIDKCGVILQLQQIRLETPYYPSTRLAVRLPSLSFHFSPARYHRLMQVIKIFEGEDDDSSEFRRPWNQADLEGWLSLLTWKGVGIREAVWQRRYFCLVGPFLYVLESPDSRSYKQYTSLRGKQVYQVPPEFVGNAEHVLVVGSPIRSNNKVVEDANALILRCESEDSRKTWHGRLQGAIYYASDSAPISGLSGTSSDDDTETEHDSQAVTDIAVAERLFVTGVLDELKSGQSLIKVLSNEEKRLFEFRAIGGQVELSIRDNDIFIGTILKSLEIEDLVCQQSQPCYLARSFIGTADAHLLFYNTMREDGESSGLTPTETDDKFYEAPETLTDVADYPLQSPGGTSKFSASSHSETKFNYSSFEPPTFSRITGLLPSDASSASTKEIELSDTLESFVKAQIVIYDQNSTRYNNMDKQVIVTLATLTFFCRRPTILAIMEFINSINIEDGNLATSSGSSSTTIVQNGVSRDLDNLHATTIEEHAVKGLLGKGKSRIMFNLTLKMAQAQIFLMKENETKLACLSQESLLTDIKVFPSSFSIKAALGNLKISDDSLPSSHLYYWACDMRNPGGRSFVELEFTSFSSDDEDYEGYDFSLFGELSEVRIVYLNRFVQEVVGYFMGLVPSSPKSVIKVTDQVTNSEKWFSASEIEGSPAVKFDLSLKKPIILMPRRTDSLDFLRLDIVHITVKNTFQWIGGGKSEMNAVHMETLMVQVEDINLNVGTGTQIGESIIQDVNGLSVIIQRSLRDLLHQFPSTEVIIKIEEMKAAVSNKEYQIITECAVSNFSEDPHIPPPLNQCSSMTSNDAIGDIVPEVTDGVDSRTVNFEAFILLKVCVSINLVELSLYAGVTRDASLATVQVSGAWLLYKSNTAGKGFLSATLQGFSVFDDREGVEKEFRLAIGKPENFGASPLNTFSYHQNQDSVDSSKVKENSFEPVPTMLIVDVKFAQDSTFVSVCVQRPQLLVALDFLLAVVEFFVPTVSSILSYEEHNMSHMLEAIIVDQSIFKQPCAEFSLSPQKPLIVDDGSFDLFIYDGDGGTLYLKDGQGFNLTETSSEALIYVGSGKKLQFRNVVIKGGQHLDSCVFLGANSSYSASKDDNVYLEGFEESPQQRSLRGSIDEVPCQSNAVNNSTELIIELQAVGPELTFYNTSKDVGELLNLSNKLLLAQLDAFCRIVLKGNNTEMSTDVLGLTMESNGIRILEPFDTSLKYSNASGKTNIHLSVSDIFMNFTFSILRLFLAVEDDILAFLRMTSKKMTIVCSHFDKVGTVKNSHTDQTYAFWRPHAPPGFAVLGDYLTPLDKPPTKGVLAINTNSITVKKPVSFRLIWPPLTSAGSKEIDNSDLSWKTEEDGYCSIWFPVAPKGYVALGCVVTHGRTPPPLSSAFCIPSSLVSPCSLRDCITIGITDICSSSVAFWRVDNSVGTFLPADPITLSLIGKAYELRCIKYDFLKPSSAASSSLDSHAPSGEHQASQFEQSSEANSNRRFEPVASFQLIWWNQGSHSRKRLSIWRPVVPTGMVYFGDIAVKGYERPNNCIVLHDPNDENICRAPIDFQLVGQVKKQRGMESISFWLPQAPPGFASLGCVACKGKPKQNELSTLRCMRGDLVVGDTFLEDSMWDTSDVRHATEPFSIWAVGNELGTFIVRGGFKKPPRRFALKLADSSVPSGSDVIVIDAEIGTFSTALFDDYGGLMVPLFNISSSGITFSLHGRTEYLNCTVSFSLAARSYNDKYEAWEPLVEPVDGFLRYQYDLNAPGAASQLRLTSTREMNLNVSVSNANMIIQAYASWNNLSHAHECYKNRDAFSPTSGGSSIIDTLHKRNYYIIPQNKLGQDIFIRATEARGLQNIVRMPSGDMKAVKVPVSKNMLDSHLNGQLCRKVRTMVTIIIAEAQFPRVEGSDSQQYTVAVRLSPNQSLPTDALVHQQSARTCGRRAHHLLHSNLEFVKWNEIFFFKVDSLEHYSLELIVTDMSKGVPVGFFSGSLNQIARTIEDFSFLQNFAYKLYWIDLSAENSMRFLDDHYEKSLQKLQCAVLVHSSDVENNDQPSNYDGRKSGFIQISPSKEGPWTTVRLNYAASAACWRLGNDVVASEVSVKDGNRYVNIRSLVSVRNNTDFVLDLCLTPLSSKEKVNLLKNSNNSEPNLAENNRVQTDEFYETEKFTPDIGWVSCSGFPGQHMSEAGKFHQAFSGIDLPEGWEWIDDWHLDTKSTNTSDGWIYAPDVEKLRWPESFDPKESSNCARQRRWLRSRKLIADYPKHEISIGLLQPGETVPLPLSGLTQSVQYFLKLRPWTSATSSEYNWSSVVNRPSQPEDAGKREQCSKLCVSALSESEELLCCSEMHGTSDGSHKLWFCVSIQATEIAKDMHSDAIQDWCLVVKSPLQISNFLPLTAEYSVLEMQPSGHFLACSRGIFLSGKIVHIYTADIRNPLFFSLLPQRGWLPIHEAVLISHPHGIPSKTVSLRSSISGRVIQVILEQNYDIEHPLLAKTIRVYAPYWLGVARCPPLTFRILHMSGKRHMPKIAAQFQTNKKNGLILEEITEEEIYDGYTIASALNFNVLALSVAIAQSGNEHFGPVKDLSPLGDMDGSLDIYAYDADGNCLRLFISTKPCPYQSVPTKVISVRPFMTFTNRLGQDIFIKLSTEDEPKVLHASDSRVSFVYRGIGGREKLQVKLEDTNWSFPLQILREDTISLVLRTHDGTLKFLRTEIRGYEEGSRFVVVFRLGSTDGPIRIENRTTNKALSIRQSGFGEDAWIQLQPLSTTNFSWEDPYGDKFLDAKLSDDDSSALCKLDLGRTGLFSAEFGLQFHVINGGGIIIAKFRDDSMLNSSSHGDIRGPMAGQNSGVSGVQADMQNSAPFEILIELGVVGISLVDHRPKELSYLYLERVFLSYSTGYDGGRTSRFKLILGYLQLDNQLPLTLMPVLLAPEQSSDVQHSVFKMTITMQNENKDGIQVYPYVYIRVTEKCWRLDIHEPIIWAVVDFYNNLQLDRLPKSSTVTEVDPEIRFDLIDVSEVRLKLSLETAPGQRPHGVLGIWSPILSAVGNAFKIQVHLRRVMHRDRFMRRSSIVPAIGNRVWRDLIHNPLHLIFSVDVLGMTSSTLASLSKGFAELSTDGQFLQLRAKQVRSRRITGVGDGIIQGTEALAQGVAFGVSGVVRKPVESARQNGLLGLAHGLGRAFLGFIVQPVSGALDFFSLTVDGIGASCSKCLEVFNSKTTFHRIRNPRAIRANGVLTEYSEREAIGQMMLYLGEASRQFGCTEIFKEPSKFALSDYYEEHFIVPHKRIVLVTNKRVMLLQCLAPDKMDKKPCKIMWDVPWDELMALELAKAGSNQPSHLILHLRHFQRSENFVQVIKCNSVEEFEGAEPQAVKICSVVRRTWKAYQTDMKSLILKVPASQRHVHFAWSEVDSREPRTPNKAIVSSREISSQSATSDDRRFVKHSITFSKIWSSEQEYKSRCSLCRKQVSQDGGICSIWRPVCPDGYTYIGDIAHAGIHPPNVAAVYRKVEGLFALPVGYDLVWRNCKEDYVTPVSIWHPRAPDGFVSPGCVAVDGYMEPEPDLVYCIAQSFVEETEFEEQKVWSAPDSYPWGCHIYQVQSDALHFVALRQIKEESNWKPMRVRDDPHRQLQS